MLDHKTVLITGAAGGLGRAFALGFGGAGYAVAVADINAAGAQETAELLQAEGVNAAAFEVDVTSTSSTEQLAKNVAEFGDGTIDALINNAAIYATVQRSPFEEIDPSEWDLVMGVNLKGPWLMARAASPYLAENGRVINISSATVFSGSAQWAHYVASKGGVIALTRVLAKELGSRGVTANCIAPGFTLTDASLNLMEDAESYGVDRGAIKRSSQPEDIVGTALFLASDAAGYMTGQTLVVDGGRQFI
ncbi:SDR family NAD(P)-dependent oxidoreductase [Corynebacterium lubricantis]|uniref:SDR family NAD(P)-dependent oxidoreductase n=1 Tax=Corynebacterium lubricantis TaxID=541095 RepID=UPI00035E5CC4|nr:SDR family oxidoreductase [Corynebacterium lubricantis]